MPVKKKYFLDSSRKLVDEVAGWLWQRVREDRSGALSLAHMMVVVPTAQSGRALRLALAKKAGESGRGILPPRVVQSMQLIVPGEKIAVNANEEYSVANSIKLQAAFLKFVQERPRRKMIGTRIVLEEWHTLFRAEFIHDFKSHLSFYDQLSDIWRILAGGGLLMREVSSSERAQECLAAAGGDELRRWQELAEFENAFFGYLHSLGLMHEAEAIHLSKINAQRISDDVEEVVLPALVDPVRVMYDVIDAQRDELKVSVLISADESQAEKFDEWGRPVADEWTGDSSPVLSGVRNEDVIRSSTNVELARKIADDFLKDNSDNELPSLGLCDETLFPELSAAFLNQGYELHNPERHSLSASSLGHIVSALVTVYTDREKGIEWETLASLIRSDDVISALLAQGEKLGIKRTNVLNGMDICRNTFLPQYFPVEVNFETSRLKKFETDDFKQFIEAAKIFRSWVDCSFDESHAITEFVRAMFSRIFAGRSFGADDKEFKVALDAISSLLREFEDDCFKSVGLREGAVAALLRKGIAEASYALEPDSPQALKTEGWLELLWSVKGKIALAGFDEGVVPDAVVGHPFLPESLRGALGLVTNESRLARDTYLFSAMLRARSSEPGSVRVYVSQSDDSGNLHRPSRLLFLCRRDELSERAKALFGKLPPGEPLPPRRMVEAWQLRLPNEVAMYGTREEYPEGRLTASAIDDWLKCPLTYLLQDALEMRHVEEKSELGPDDFGTIIHRALELYALEQLERTAKGMAQFHEVEDIRASLRKIMNEIRESFSSNKAVKLKLQLVAAEERLMSFARVQADWAGDGWVIKEKPEYSFVTRPFEGEEGCDVPVKGMIDRIDFKPGVGYRLIDYKTWDQRSGAQKRIVNGGADEIAHAETLKLPRLNPGEDVSKQKRLMTVQLPLYGRCLEKFVPEVFAGRIADYCYAILGVSDADVVVLGSKYDCSEFKAVKKGAFKIADHVEFALETARTAIKRIKANIFWPPGPSEHWKYNFSEVFTVSPEFDLAGSQWLETQQLRLAQLLRFTEL